MEERKTIGVVLINYFNDEEVISFIRNYLLNQPGNGIQIYVTDNGSKSGALKSFCEKQALIKYSDPGKNLGYIGGFLYACKSLDKQKPDLMILSNSDIEIEKSLLNNISKLELQQDEVMIGPSIISTRTGKRQNPFYEIRISNSKLQMLNFAFSNYLTYAAYQFLGIAKAMVKGVSKEGSNERERHIYAIHGSFMIFKTSFIEKYFTELEDAPFLFGEEIQFAEVALKHQLKTLYCPQFIVKHHEHATTKLFKSGKMLKYLKDSIAFRLEKRKEQG